MRNATQEPSPARGFPFQQTAQSRSWGLVTERMGWGGDGGDEKKTSSREFPVASKGPKHTAAPTFLAIGIFVLLIRRRVASEGWREKRFSLGGFIFRKSSFGIY